ncbi:MAG: patatin-like phospholipase family protein [Ruminococcaceae bacterium]|jgi:NTE family protein|nr:patatin-like phospholipase family protein [Oscillospiraceae bacterium]
MKPYGLILAGGGAKGAYQMGAWKAMREMGIKIEAIAGVSIGAINGALIAQGDYDRALDLWNNVEVADGINLPGELKDPSNLFSKSNMVQIVKEVIKNGGVDATPAKELIAKYIDEDKVRQSSLPLGLVTYNLSGMKPVEIFIDEMENGKLIDYLMASARFPGLANQGPDDQSYFDGGVYDNAPISVLRDRGINRLIIVDISTMKGMAHRKDLSNAEIIFIRPYDPKDLGESFEFEKEKNQARIEMGYLDTKKAFGFLAGRCFYFMPREYKILQQKYGFRVANDMELLAFSLGIERFKVYTAKRFVEELKKEYVEAKQETTEVRQVLGRKIIPRSEDRKEALKAILSRDKKNYKFKYAIDILEEMTDGMTPEVTAETEENTIVEEPETNEE